nr:phage tail tape measure protein [Pseudomonas sp. PDM18]
MVGINALQQERLNSLAAELDKLQKLKQANEDAAKAAAYRSALDQENKTVSVGFEIELAGTGKGDKFRSRLQEMLQIRQSYDEKLSELASQRNSGDISQELYDQETAILQEALDQRLGLQEDYYARVDEAQGNWMSGVNDAFQNYVDSAADYSQQASDAVTDVLGNATSSLSDGIQGLLNDTNNLSEALGNVATTIGDTIVAAIADMAAQWLVAQAIQLMFGKASESPPLRQAPSWTTPWIACWRISAKEGRRHLSSISTTLPRAPR